jgi:protein O-mannosyl-transferase
MGNLTRRSPPRGGPADAEPASPRRILTPARVLAPLVVALVTVVAFLPTLNNGFLDWDDEETLVTNLHYRGLGWKNLRWMLTTTLMGHWLPLTWVTFAADYLVWGMNPFGYHLSNLLLHTGAAVVFYFVALRLLRAAGASRSDTVLRAAAGAAALFFAIHPLRVESVAWVTERRDVLSGLWFLLTILTYLKAAAGARRWWLAGSVGCYTLAVLSKGIVMSLPVVLVLLDVYPLRRLSGGWRQWIAPEARRVWAKKIPYLLLALAAAGMAIYAGHSIADPFDARPLTARIGVALYGLAFYVQKTAVPVGISPLYQIPGRVDPLVLPIVVNALAVAVVTVGLFLVRRKWPAGLAVWLSYAILLAPVSGVMQSGPQLVASRYSYLPCLGWALLVGGAVCLVHRAVASGGFRPIWARAGAAAMVVCLAVLGALTWGQARIWRDSKALWSYAVSVAPTSSIAHSNLGAVLFREGKLDEARAQFQKAVQLSPSYADALTNLAFVLGELDRAEEATETLKHLSSALVGQGKLDKAIAILQGLVEIHPTDAEAHNALGFALFLRGDREPAVQHFRRALQLDPRLREAKENLEYALAQMKQ